VGEVGGGEGGDARGGRGHEGHELGLEAGKGGLVGLVWTGLGRWWKWRCTV
jgi:hypothetical protein